MNRDPLAQLAHALTYLSGMLLDGEHLSFTRNAKSVRFDARATGLPALVRSMIENEEERQGFALRLVPPGNEAVHAIADGVLWLDKDERLSIERSGNVLDMHLCTIGGTPFEISLGLAPSPAEVRRALADLRATFEAA